MGGRDWLYVIQTKDKIIIQKITLYSYNFESHISMADSIEDLTEMMGLNFQSAFSCEPKSTHSRGIIDLTYAPVPQTAFNHRLGQRCNSS